jgi:hypothetical protein
MTDSVLDSQIDKLHFELEARERDARAAELRLQRLALPPGSLKPRAYGELPNVAGLTARAMVARQDPALAMLLQIPVPRPSYEDAAAAEAREQQIQRMRDVTEAARQQNQQAQHQRYQQQLSGVDQWGRPRWAR